MSDYWTDNNIEKPQAIVVCSACKYNELIICSARHWDKLMNSQYAKLKNSNMELESKVKWEQGFINQFGEFLTRREALHVVIVSNQKFDLERNGVTTALFSEGLY